MNINIITNVSISSFIHNLIKERWRVGVSPTMNLQLGRQFNGSVTLFHPNYLYTYRAEEGGNSTVYLRHADETYLSTNLGVIRTTYNALK